MTFPYSKFCGRVRLDLDLGNVSVRRRKVLLVSVGSGSSLSEL